jgi:hypothetical protein
MGEVGGDIELSSDGDLTAASAVDGLPVVERDLNMPRRRLVLRSGVMLAFARQCSVLRRAIDNVSQGNEVLGRSGEVSSELLADRCSFATRLIVRCRGD